MLREKDAAETKSNGKAGRALSRQVRRRLKLIHSRKQYAHPDRFRVPWQTERVVIDRKHAPRSKYMPHIGDKQIAKAKARAAL
jgi:hypothetical protein